MKNRYIEFTTKSQRGNHSIDYYKFSQLLVELGFVKVKIHDVTRLAHIEGKIVDLVDREFVNEEVLKFLESDEFRVSNPDYEKILSAVYKESSKLFGIANLENLPVSDIKFLKDDENQTFIAFKNGVVRIDKNSIDLLDYDQLPGYILKQRIKCFEFKKDYINCAYQEFLWKALGQNLSRYKSFVSTVGYLVNRYKNPSNPKLVFLIDELADESNMADGGRGKTLLLKALNYVTNVVEISGKDHKINSNHPFQSVDETTDLVVINDLVKTENFESYYNRATEGFVINKKYKKEIVIPFESSPKIAFTSNNLIRFPQGNSSDRRKHEVEISGYYGSHLTPEQDLEHKLFVDWNEQEWTAFFNYIAWCVQYFHCFGLIESPEINIGYRRVLTEVGPELFEFLTEKEIETSDVINVKDLYGEYKDGNYVNRRFLPNIGNYSRKVKRYLQFKGREICTKSKSGLSKIILQAQQSKEPKEDNKTKYVEVVSEEQLQQTVSELTGKDLCFDFETSCLDIYKSKVLGLAVQSDMKTAYYIPFNKGLLQEQIIKKITPLFDDRSTKKIGHNIKFDIQVLFKLGIGIKGEIHDTMIQHYVLFPTHKKRGLKELSKQFFDHNQLTFDQLTKGKSLEEIDSAKVVNYACDDTNYTLKLFHHFSSLLDPDLTEVYNRDRGLISVLAKMEFQGVQIDLDQVNELERVLACELQLIESDFPSDLNLSSPKQVSDYLFSHCGITPKEPVKDNGTYSTSKLALSKIAGGNPIVDSILKHREIKKVLDTFIPALKSVNQVTGRIHCNFNQAVTVTGRLSSSNPNLQNIPNRSKGGKLRSCFTASKGNVLIGVDYSNIEMRVIAILSKDAKLLEAYKNGIDVHKLTASKLFDVEMGSVTNNQRAVAKTVNFGLIYGMSSKGLRQRLQQAIGKELPLDQCKQFREKFFKLYSGIKSYHSSLMESCTKQEAAFTFFGRKRPIPLIVSDNSYERQKAKRHAMNTPIQGTAADIIRIAMVEIDKQIEQRGLDSKMILQVHDELLFDVPQSEEIEMTSIIKQQMINVGDFEIPLDIDLKVGQNWGEVH